MKERSESKMPWWSDKGLISKMELSEDVVLTLCWLEIGCWVMDLNVSGHSLIKGRELNGIGQDRRGSAKRLALMFTANHLSVQGMRMVEVGTVASALLEKAVRDEMERLKEERGTPEGQS